MPNKFNIVVITDNQELRTEITHCLDSLSNHARIIFPEDIDENLIKYPVNTTILDITEHSYDEVIKKVSNLKGFDTSLKIGITKNDISKQETLNLYEQNISLLFRREFVAKELHWVINSHIGNSKLKKEFDENKTIYETLINTSPDGYMLLECNGKITYFNENFKHLTEFFFNSEIRIHSVLSADDIKSKYKSLLLNYKNILSYQIEHFQVDYKIKTKYIRLIGYLVKEDMDEPSICLIAMDMTESHSLRDKLKENITLLDNITKTLPFAIYLYDTAEKKKTLLNSEPFSNWGITHSELEIDNWVATRIHDQDKPRVSQHYRKLEEWNTDQTQTIETRFKKDDGEYIWIRATDVPFYMDKEKSKRYLLGAIQNINDYKELLERVHTSKIDISSVLSTIEDAVWSLDTEMKLRFKNDALNKIWAEFFPGEEVISDAQLKSNRSYLTSFIDLHKEALLGKKVHFTYQSKIKSDRYFEVFINPIYREDKIIGAVGVMKDVSNYINDKNKLDEANKRLQLATDTAKIGIFEWNILDNTVIWNDVMYNLYEVKRDFNLTYKNWLKLVHPEDRGHVINLRKAKDNVKSNFTDIFRVVQTKDGVENIKFIQPSAKLYKSPDGKVQKLIGVNIDVTSSVSEQKQLVSHKDLLETRINIKTKELQEEIELRKLAEKELEKALDRQVDFNKQKSKFVQMISHEFRTPLTQITMSSDLLELLIAKLGPEYSEKSAKYIDVQKSGIDQMTNILSITGKFFHIQEQLVYPVIKIFDFNSLMNKVISDIVNSKEISFSRIKLDSITHNTMIETSEDILYQSFFQILDNSIRYSDAEGIVTITIDRTSDGLKVVVKDTGYGVLPEDLPYITDLFRRGSDQNNLGSQRGLGIGLTIAKLSFDALKSKMIIDSEYGKGTTITCYIQSDPDIFRSSNYN